jgi:Flp pilus assembly protein TadD
MSLLMKALKSAERPPQASDAGGGAEWTLAPMDAPGAAGGATPRSAQAAADLIRSHAASRERTRLLILLGLLVSVVLGMGGYFYVAVYMPALLLLPTPPAGPVSAPPAPPAPLAAEPEAPSLVQSLPAAPEVSPPAVQETRPAKPESVPAPQRRPLAGEPKAPPKRLLVPATASPTVSSTLAAYELLQAGQYDRARQAYETLRATEPANPDVILGLAVIAHRQNRLEEAAQWYLRAIELDPHNTFAQAGLVSIIGKVDPATAEARLKQLAGQQPAPYLFFALGNLYAAQGRWNDAQGSYFEAQRMAPDSADYAFNLAVSLEHIGQPKAAAEYYQRALRLAQGGAATSFDPALARDRLQQLPRQ